ncbi:MAG: hypothetical protein AB8H79_12860 [Myxococcota bacterium]
MTDDIQKEYDVRVVDFHLRRRSVSREDFNKYLEALPDDAEEGQETVTRFEPSFNRGDDS